MNFQGNRQWTGLFSAHRNTGKNEGVRHIVMSQRRTTTTDAAKTTIGSSRLKHLQFERFKETGKNWCFPTHDEEKGKQSSATRFRHSKSCDKSTLKKYQEVKVYRSFIEEEATEDLERSKNSTAFEKTLQEKVTLHNAGQTTEACAVNPSRVKAPNHAVRRYALYRGMLRQ